MIASIVMSVSCKVVEFSIHSRWKYFIVVAMLTSVLVNITTLVLLLFPKCHCSLECLASYRFRQSNVHIDCLRFPFMQQSDMSV